MNITDIQPIIDIAIKAGEAILEVYNGTLEGFGITRKEDNSPLTAADRVSHDIIVEGLTRLYPEIPILSEEGADIDYSIRKEWKQYWCVDPLDGTKEFINRNGQFTVNIAFMDKNKPVIGVIYSPVLNVVYYGIVGKGSWKMTPGEAPEVIRVDNRTSEWIAIGSKSHADEDEENILKKYPVVSKLSIGSSLKFCLVAEGKAQIYYRKGPTMEWDTAAGQAIAVSSGAIMVNADFEEFVYNKPSLLNPGFYCKIG
nr:3'(2'),5'-bisphosphate nucleotidase CysQ [Pedobacter panaciterrae]